MTHITLTHRPDGKALCGYTHVDGSERILDWNDWIVEDDETCVVCEMRLDEYGLDGR